MKNGYWVVTYRAILNESALQSYASLAGPAIQASGGKVLVRSSDVQPFEAGLKQRTVVIEFESLNQAMAAYNSEAYKAALSALGAGAERDFRIVEGI